MEAAACADWCNEWNCGVVDRRHCGGCDQCLSPPPLPPGVTGGGRIETTCADWCLVEGWLDCGQPDQCGGCPGCLPYPPPPPLAQNAFSRNPFATAGGWLVNPSMRANLLRTLARASSQGDLAASERRALAAMADSPAAVWIDSVEKIRGAHQLDSLEGVLANVTNEATLRRGGGGGSGAAPPRLCVFVLYNLPHRDCAAKASSGEISDLEQYKAQYVEPFALMLKQYDRVPAIVIVEPDSLGNLVTSDGDTSTAGGGCSEHVAAVYRDGVSYAVRTLAELAPHAAIYVDAGHGGWLGYEESAAKFARLVKELGIAPMIRGFSTNVANYQPLGSGTVCPAAAFAETGSRDARPGAGGGFRGVAHWCKEAGGKGSECCAYDPCQLLESYGGGATEIMYAQTLQRHFIRALNWAPYFVIDTGRNGAVNPRRETCARGRVNERFHQTMLVLSPPLLTLPSPQSLPNPSPVPCMIIRTVSARTNAPPLRSCSSWCNVRGAGAGHVPTMNTGLPEVIDAFFWIKTPGESDGCTRILPRDALGAGDAAATQVVSGNQACPRFDPSCESADSIGGSSTEPRAPEAGGWFEYQARELARHSSLQLDAEGALDSMYGWLAPVSQAASPPLSAHPSMSSRSPTTSRDTHSHLVQRDHPLAVHPTNDSGATNHGDAGGTRGPGIAESYADALVPPSHSLTRTESVLFTPLPATQLLGLKQTPDTTAALTGGALSLALLLGCCVFARRRGCLRRLQAATALAGIRGGVGNGVQLERRAKRSRLPLQEQDEAREAGGMHAEEPPRDEAEGRGEADGSGDAEGGARGAEGGGRHAQHELLDGSKRPSRAWQSSKGTGGKAKDAAARAGERAKMAISSTVRTSRTTMARISVADDGLELD